MKLEKICIHGFKSFADKTELTISHPITAIVGPNGCGKSNVVDAIKWVLGNQSPKSLRSGQMADVIFSGSASRKPSGMAEVSLHFSDVRGLDIEQDELQIARRLFRSGDSEYLINGKSCRLRDIRELFMDTGVGVNAYSIIEQGQIDGLLKASTTDRRVIFEEAAGVSKYKAHKKEALRKLDRTEQNLLRLADIVNEVQKQLRSVKLQAGKARNYLEYSERLKSLRVQYSLAEYDKIITQRNQKTTALNTVRDQFSETSAIVTRCDAALSEISNTLLEIESQINHWDGSLISARSRIEQQHDRIDFLNHRIQELQSQKKKAAEQISSMTLQSRQLSGQLELSRSRQGEMQTLSEQKTAELREAEQAILRINTECAELQAQLEDEKSGIIDIVRRTAQLHNEIESLNSYRDNLSGRKTRLSGKAEQNQNELSEWLTEKAQRQTRLDEIQAVLKDLHSTLDRKRAEMDAIGDERGQLLEQIAKVKEQRSAINGELNVLKEMETRRQGLNQTLIDILNESAGQHDYIEGILADIIIADQPHAAVVEAALEGMTDALLINSTGDFLQDTELQEKLDSRIRILCTDRIAPFSDSAGFANHSGVLGRLVEFVRFDSRFGPLVWNLLGRVILVDTLETALQLSGKYGGKYRFVTRSGQVLSNGHLLNVGPVGKNAGLISRKSRIQHLEAELQTIQARIDELEHSLEDTEHRNEHLSHVCSDLRTSIYEANTEKVDAESRLRVLEETIRRLKEEQPIIAGEIEVLEEEIRDSVSKEHNSRQKLDELEQINEQRQAQIQQLEETYNRQRAVRNEHQSRLTDLKVEMGQISEQQKSIVQQIASLQSQLQHSRISMEAARTEMASCTDQIAQTERNILAAGSRISELYLEKEQAAAHSAECHRRSELLLQEKTENAEQLRIHRSRESEIEEQMHKLELDLSQLQVKEEDLTVRVFEDLQIELAKAYEDFQQEDVDWDEVREEIAQLRGKIERLGNVNVDAIDQQQDLEERNEFLTTQVEDLNQSKGQLEQLIARINKESREKFRVTFEQIRENFQELFRKLFGGGKADVMLENPDDILESGIEIVARPPGKETRTISLLSGGEKTMTAIALLFAVFKSKPSPFCVLDEVDAALDEANNERFNLIVQEFQKQSQFVVITHSKRTMSIADVLYGITMQTKGVSKKISVQFEGTTDAQPDTAVA